MAKKPPTKAGEGQKILPSKHQLPPTYEGRRLTDFVSKTAGGDWSTRKTDNEHDLDMLNLATRPHRKPDSLSFPDVPPTRMSELAPHLVTAQTPCDCVPVPLRHVKSKKRKAPRASAAGVDNKEDELEAGSAFVSASALPGLQSLGWVVLTIDCPVQDNSAHE